MMLTWDKEQRNVPEHLDGAHTSDCVKKASADFVIVVLLDGKA